MKKLKKDEGRVAEADADKSATAKLDDFDRRTSVTVGSRPTPTTDGVSH